MTAQMNSWKQKTQEHWNKTPCGTEEEHVKRYVLYPWLKEILEKINNKRVLEIGCGQGTDLQLLSKKNEAFGIDITPKHLEISKSKGLNVRYGDAEKIPFKKGSFDVVYSFGVLHHTPDIKKAIREIHRVLRPKGKAIVMIYHKNSLLYYHSILLYRGIIRAQLITLGKRRLLSQIEKGPGTVLVQLYTKKEVQKLFKAFKIKKIRIFELKRETISGIGRIIPQKYFDKLESRFGFFMVIEAVKEG